MSLSQIALVQPKCAAEMGVWLLNHLLQHIILEFRKINKLLQYSVGT